MVGGATRQESRGATRRESRARETSIESTGAPPDRSSEGSKGWSGGASPRAAACPSVQRNALIESTVLGSMCPRGSRQYPDTSTRRWKNAWSNGVRALARGCAGGAPRPSCPCQPRSSGVPPTCAGARPNSRGGASLPDSAQVTHRARRAQPPLRTNRTRRVLQGGARGLAGRRAGAAEARGGRAHVLLPVAAAALQDEPIVWRAVHARGRGGACVQPRRGVEGDVGQKVERVHSRAPLARHLARRGAAPARRRAHNRARHPAVSRRRARKVLRRAWR